MNRVWGRQMISEDTRGQVSGSRIGVRVIRYGIWSDVLLKDWCRYKAYDHGGTHRPSPPTLAPARAKHVHFTDLESTSGHYSPEALARRLSLEHVEQFLEEGALVVLFPLAGCDASVPVLGGQPVVTTEGGAKQWITADNVSFSEEHQIFWVLPSALVARSQRGLENPTPDQANKFARWFLESARLTDEDYWNEVLLKYSESMASEGTSFPRDGDEIDSILSNL